MAGVRVTLDMDLVAIRQDAKLWLPCSGPNKLDRGHGWALSHPLGWMQKYKQEAQAIAMQRLIHIQEIAMQRLIDQEEDE